MLIEVKVPQLSESVAEATLVSWHKKEGEAVARDENLIDIETDKVVLELPARTLWRPAYKALAEAGRQRKGVQPLPGHQHGNQAVKRRQEPVEVDHAENEPDMERQEQEQHDLGLDLEWNIVVGHNADYGSTTCGILQLERGLVQCSFWGSPVLGVRQVQVL